MIKNMKENDLFQIQGQNPMSATLSDNGDISKIFMFHWYELCYFHEQSRYLSLSKV